MDILEQCQIWNDEHDYQRIVDALEKLPAGERTPETDSELARALNNLADPAQPEGRAMLKRAIHLLSHHKDHFRDDHRWNFRMGYAYYYLGREDRALPYFEKALEALPGDEDTLTLLNGCRRFLSMPQFKDSFRQRTERAWAAFAQEEARLRRSMDEDKEHQHGDELMEQCGELLHLAFEDISFELGHNGEKHELILTPEGDRIRLMELMYFRSHAPREVLEHWSILVGRQPMSHPGIHAHGLEICAHDVEVSVERLDQSSVGLTLYSRKLLHLLHEDEDHCWWMLSTLTDQVLGEIPAMRYISEFNVVDKPLKGPSILLSSLPDTLSAMGLDLSTDPEAYLGSCVTYRMEPDPDPEADWRMDIMVGSTCCPPLINDYMNVDNSAMDRLHADGAAAGFFFYPLDGFTGEDKSQQIFDFRDQLEAALTENGKDALTLTGGATGLHYGYVDFIAWDMREALRIAHDFFEASQLPWANFHVFRRDAGGVRLMEHETEEGTEDAETPEEKHSSRGAFAGFVLLSKPQWDKAQLIRDLKEKWDITVEEDDDGDIRDDALVFSVDDMIAAVSLMPAPIPGGEAEVNAENNYMWPEAVKAAKAHKAHIMVAMLGKDDLLERGKLYTKLVAACCRQKYASGVYTSGVVFEPAFYEDFADMMQEGQLPIFNWIWFGLYRSGAGMCAYTYGMEVFGKDEMEVLDADAKPSELRDFLASLVSYVLESDVTLRDGETIGFSAGDKHQIARSPGVGLPEDQMTLKISWESSDGDPEDGGEGDPDGEGPQDEGPGEPEVYTEEEMEAVERYIQQYFGKFENVFHELVSPDIHVDICVVPPSKERDYYTLVTMGMGAHRMNVPEELAEYKLERAELAIALPADWKLKQEDLKNEQWYWPIRLLKVLARLPIASDTWLGFGHTMDNEEDFANGTKLCAAILIGPQTAEEDSEVCTLPSGEEVNFYQVLPLYRDELEYKMAHDADALLDKMDGISFVVEPDRQNAITRDTLCSEEDDDSIGMDDASYHIESIEEKELPIDPINACSHMAIYLRWCMEHDLMGEEFLAEYGEVVEKVKADPASVDLRAFIQEELYGCLFSALFDQKGRAFAGYYYGEGDSPYYPSDIDDYALRYFGPARYHSDEFQEEAYLFIPFDEDYYRAMADVINERFTNWQEQDFDEDTLEPSELAEALMEYLDCECTYFPSMKDDDPITAAFGYAQRLGVREGFIPVLIRADDETLLECLVMNADPEHDADCYEFDLKTVEEYRKKMLTAPIKDGKAVLEELTGQRKEEAADDDMDWDEEVLGEMEGGEPNDRFGSYWDLETEMTAPLILAKLPVKEPWEVFAYLPFGGWNDCPDTPELMAAAKYWSQQYGAVPAALSHDELEFILSAPVPKEKAMEVAVEQYGFCPDVVDQGPEEASVGLLADTLRQSRLWYFWWD